ncbi:MAG TPA: UDP-glucose--hexose-1-phosphate uridylyltransferase [Epulopiscium sp.]|nr:UDP-glucose--hexose-1-phosphate uridylyltransferase [Candidatus Epulonipiscium sp.]
MNIEIGIEKLMEFAKEKNIVILEDEDYIRNTLLDLFNLDQPHIGEITGEKICNIQEALDPLLDAGFKLGLIPENTTTYRDLLEAKIMGIVVPRPSEVIRIFNKIANEEGIEKATDNFYKLSKDSNYIQMNRIAKNLYWREATKYGDLEITINLSKPEKDAKEIERLRDMPQSNYPKCLLCTENVGFRGSLNHPARQNHRIIPINMVGEKWYLQYSPYVYYNEHCIVLSEKHSPMSMTSETFVRLLGFVEQFPHYFLGANAGLPVVGGSIMSHEHYQGGRHEFPMEVASLEYSFGHKDYKGVKVGIVKWPLSVIRISGQNKEDIIKTGSYILDTWEKYTDESVGIIPFTKEENGQMTPHSTITPIARKNKQGEYELDLALRNNRRSVERPDGIFHPRPALHHIKKENIGLIEVMGLAILPGRLDAELTKIADEMRKEKIDIPEGSDLKKHEEWIKNMRDQYGIKMSAEQAAKTIRYEVGRKFTQVLEDAGVYKTDNEGRAAFVKFIKHMGFELK